ncbi:MAG: copper-binding protein, partial [Candidatus Rokuibacteriota bacterium]
RSPRRGWLVLTALFAVLLGSLAIGIWGTILRPAAYEVRGELVARPSANTILVRHDPIPALGMGAMELMAVHVDPAVFEASEARVGDRVRLAVRPVDDQLILVRIERLN